MRAWKDKPKGKKAWRNNLGVGPVGLIVYGVLTFGTIWTAAMLPALDNFTPTLLIMPTLLTIFFGITGWILLKPGREDDCQR